MSKQRRIVLAAFGSWGDVLPYTAIALGLKERGHQAILATSACYREKVEGLGIAFRTLRPDSDWVSNPQLMRRRSSLGLGLIRVATEWVLPPLRESYEDIAAAVDGADLLVSHPLVAWAARLVAEKNGVGWVSTMLVPLGFFSAYDETVFPVPAMLAAPLRMRSRRLRSVYLRIGARATRFLAKPWYRLRRELDLPAAPDGNPLRESHSPLLNLALFSKVLADKQPDWPARTQITGFPIGRDGAGMDLPATLVRFLDDGPPPIVFTLGTALGSDARGFYETSVAAARRLGCRAVLVGKGANAGTEGGADVIALEYAPYLELFPRAAVIVHHGGIGSIGLAMRSGRPMLVAPRAWDQPDNAARVARLGIARVLDVHRYTESSLARELRELLGQGYVQRAAAVRQQLLEEDGVTAACDALEAQMEGRTNIIDSP
jgi:UDP:flavonoid glycosyltransferase YjiC (YdhE family)